MIKIFIKSPEREEVTNNMPKESKIYKIIIKKKDELQRVEGKKFLYF